MSIVVMGLSHHTSPIDVLERVALDAAGAQALARAVVSGHNVSESVVIATCNRLEVYAQVATFHGAVDDIGAALVRATGMSRAVALATATGTGGEGGFFFALLSEHAVTARTERRTKTRR